MISLDLSRKVAIVTGAARGIGLAIAKQLCAAGACVVVNDLDEDACQQAVKMLRAEGRQAEAAPGDITRPETPEKLVQSALFAFNGIDIVVNNAGYTWDSVIQKTTDAQYQAMLDVHMVAPFRLLRAASFHIREVAKAEIADGQRVMRKVVNITSIAGTDGNPGQSGYSSGKAGVLGLTKTLAKEWGRYNVNVNAVGFGLIDTRLIQPMRNNQAPVIEISGRQIPVGVPEQMRDQIKQSCPLGRLGTPEEAANAVFFFCSPLSDYVTGEVLICGGGLHF